MRIEDIKPGWRYTYFPPKEHVNDNLHPVACVDEKHHLTMSKRVRVTLFYAGAETGKRRCVSPKRLADQPALL